MTYYKLVEIKDSLLESIAKEIESICKENNINYKKQEYRILFCNEKVLYKNNGIRFTSGIKKYLCFYGKTYLNKTGKITESIDLENEIVNLDPESNDALIIFGGVDNSTLVEKDEELLHFYVAPTHLLGLQDPKLWQIL